MSKNEIQMFFHCKKCIEELPDNTAPRDWVRVESGWTTRGLQIWCLRHNMNIIHVDLMGQKVSAK